MAHADGPGAENPKHRILLFGASWCAPCIKELRSMGKLASAAKPDRIVIVWTDGGIRRYRVPSYQNVEIASDTQGRMLVSKFTSGSAGLPYSVMIDERDRKCAEWNKSLTPDAMTVMRNICIANRSKS